MKFDHETAAEWYERAIVANSIAAAQKEALAGAGNPTAIGVAHKHADQAAAQLQQALEALQAHRQLEHQFRRR